MAGDPTSTMVVTTAVSSVVSILIVIVSRAFYGGQSSGEVKQRLGSIEVAIVAMQTDFKKLTDVLINQADMQARMARSEEDIRDLRRGRGFIKDRSEGGINGEYP
jgi:hypothetical protein